MSGAGGPFAGGPAAVPSSACNTSIDGCSQQQQQPAWQQQGQPHGALPHERHGPRKGFGRHRRAQHGVAASSSGGTDLMLGADTHGPHSLSQAQYGSLQQQCGQHEQMQPQQQGNTAPRNMTNSAKKRFRLFKRKLSVSALRFAGLGGGGQGHGHGHGQETETETEQDVKSEGMMKCEG